MADFDLLEDGFCPLPYARVLAADYDLLRLDFPQLENLSVTEIDTWLLKNAAYISEGQTKRCDAVGWAIRFATSFVSPLPGIRV